jgi:protein-S-isoprenylcysteine O-methyltransferase Ste14
MSNPDLLVYAVHAAFWAAFGLTRVLVRTPAALPAAAAAGTPVADREQTAPFSRALLIFHMTAFGVMYFGIANAVLPDRVPSWFVGQRVVGALVIALGATLMCWTLVVFRSWRFRAKLDQGHQLTTDGPFRVLRHPIYMGLNLLALGTAIWVPSILVWLAFVLMALGGDFRARNEEALLGRAFGSAYAEYSRRTKRFIPGLY